MGTKGYISLDCRASDNRDLGMVQLEVLIGGNAKNFNITNCFRDIKCPPLILHLTVESHGGFSKCP